MEQELNRNPSDGTTDAESIAAEIYGLNSTDAKLNVMRSLLADIKMIAEHGIPYYAFGDNEAACDMNNRLAEIYSLASNDV